MPCQSKFRVSGGKSVAIWADGPLSANDYRHIVRLLSLDLEIMVEAEARELALLVDKLPAWTPGIKPEDAERWFTWFSALWAAAQELEERRRAPHSTCGMCEGDGCFDLGSGRAVDCPECGADAQGMPLREDSRSEAEAEGLQPGPATRDAPDAL
jgi:hypothetical protein